MGTEPVSTELPDEYSDLLNELAGRIHGARLQAALAANRELVLLYWHIGRDILTRQRAEGWRTRVIDRLAKDLRLAFSDVTGLSVQSELAQQIIKDPHNFEFLPISVVLRERDLEGGFIAHPQSLTSGTWQRIRVCRHAVPARRRWARLLPRSIVLSTDTALFCGCVSLI